MLSEMGLVTMGRLEQLRQAYVAHVAEANHPTAHGATSVATPQRIVTRDVSGRAQVVDPLVNADIANRGWVLGQISVAGGGVSLSEGGGISCNPNPITGTGTISLTAPPGVVTGTFDAPRVTIDGYGRVIGAQASSALLGISVSGGLTKTGTTTSPIIGLPAASGSAAGSMSAYHFTRLQDATATMTASTIMMRDANNQALVATTPTHPNHATSKTYVDGRSFTPAIGSMYFTKNPIYSGYGSNQYYQFATAGVGGSRTVTYDGYGALNTMSCSPASGTFTISEAGLYIAMCSIATFTSSDNPDLIAFFSINGSLLARSVVIVKTDGANFRGDGTLIDAMSLGAGNSVAVGLYSNETGGHYHHIQTAKFVLWRVG